MFIFKLGIGHYKCVKNNTNNNIVCVVIIFVFSLVDGD